MPAKPFWWKNLAAIRAAVEAAPVPVFDRAAIEKLFGVGRRRAHALMRSWGGYQVGQPPKEHGEPTRGAVLVDKTSLLRAIESLEMTQEVRNETSRRTRVEAALGDAARTHNGRAVRIDMRQMDASAKRARDLLPTGVEVRRGELVIRFEHFDEMLSRLYAFGQALQVDAQRIKEMAE